MYDPLQTEQAYQDLLTALAGPASPRWHLLALCRFLERLDTAQTAEPYLLDLVPRLPDLLYRLDPVGLIPDDLARCIRRLDEARTGCPLLRDLPELDAADEMLRTAAATLYAYVGDVQTAFTVLSGGDAVPPWLDALDLGETMPLERLLRVAHAAQAQAHPADSALARIATDWQTRLQSGRGSTLVPVVEHLPYSHTDRLHVGGLRRLRVELYGDRTAVDDLRVDVTVFGTASNRDALLKSPLSASRRLLAETYPALAARFFAGQVCFDDRQRLHEGCSSDVAVAALFYCAALRFTQQRVQYHIASGATLTGGLDAEGAVQPVDEEALAVKVQTAFLSWVRCLAVPVEQLSAAQAVVEALEKRYPHRRLDVVGLHHLRDVFYDRRLAGYEQASRSRHLARYAWQRRFSAGSLALILLLTLAVGRLLYGPIDKNPVLGAFSGETLFVKNAAGQVIEEISVSKNTVSNCSGKRAVQCVAFLDADSDGQNEIIWTDIWWGQKERSSYLHCKSLGEHAYRWSLPLQFQLTFPYQPESLGDKYVALALTAGDFDADGQPEVIASLAHYSYFPNLVIKIDPVTGAVHSDRYVNIGRLFTLTNADLNDDGVQEILLGGGNNAFGNDPVLIVLDPRRLAGHSPLTQAYEVEHFEPAHEIAYVKIPRGPLGEERRIAVPDVYVEWLRVDQAGKEIVAYSTEGLWVDPLTQRQHNMSLLIHFNVAMELLSINTSSQYDQLFKMLVAQDSLARRPDSDFLKQLPQQFRYWNGEDWQSKPVMNWP